MKLANNRSFRCLLRLEMRVQPNNSFKPNLLRYTNNVAGKACHVVGSATQVGLTQALGATVDISVNDAMATAIWRFHNAALERAALIYTFARSTNEDTPVGYSIYRRQLVMLIDAVHDFSFNARRAIERADKHAPGLIKDLKTQAIHFGQEELALSDLDSPPSIPLTKESFWWVLGRIIHSKETMVIYKTTDVVFTHQATGRHHSIRQPVAFGFSSDFDSDKIDHYIELEPFVSLYVGAVSYQVERAINARNNPVPRAGGT